MKFGTVEIYMEECSKKIKKKDLKNCYVLKATGSTYKSYLKITKVYLLVLIIFTNQCRSYHYRDLTRKNSIRRLY